MEKELETYQVQLSQVEQSLEADPANEGLVTLRDGLKELIELTEASIAAERASSSKAESSRKAAPTAVASKTWAAGDDCLAKYSGDGQWYPARIASVGGSAERRAYSVVFRGYNTTELVDGTQMKALPGNYQAGAAGGGKRKLSKEEEEEREKKKKKNEKKLESKAAKAKEQVAKQATWQRFAKKSEKKGVHIAGVAGTSIFKTPDNPLGRVGVTGSGKGMTEVAPRGKHKFDPTEDAAS
ncbi:hypothetical protein BXZ70DRAFT_890192 [Cristinia sonorae]|uniref:Tudor domain-containing protein n=1 Tax=Cristinia sonorae TaxID=1940300 RepID=A0A8K0UR40_9AGAR|nr:hypothetical protein BXZ70DRAFT_890192 [Cristinia sonorae]